MNRIRISTIIAIFLLSFIGKANAQSFSCGTDSLYLKLKQRNPQIGLNEKIQNQQIYEKTIQSMNNPVEHVQSILTVPIVFHIIHENGPEDIPDSTIIDAVNQLNLRYMNDTPYYDSSGAAIGIQFCLASIDPNGNPTNGITRDTSYLTNLYYTDYIQDTTMKGINRWQPFLYLNVWVVRSISNGQYSGYAYYPSSVGQPEDGVVIVYYGVNTWVLSHEIGHYFWLYHTFQGGCPNYNCLLDGDLVCDTPPDSSLSFEPCPENSCNTDMNDTSGHNPFTADMNDSPNYMDYTSCPNLFTNGQAQRMNNALTGARNLLLVSNGCGQNTNVGPPIAGFRYSIDTCQTGNVTFTDTSQHYPMIYYWDFDNTGVYETSGHTVTHTYTTTGNHTCKEKVIGPGGMDSCYRTFFVKSAPFYYYPLGSFSGITVDNQGNLFTCSGTSVWMSSIPAAHYLWFNGDTTQSTTFIADTTFQLKLQITDTSGLTWRFFPCSTFFVTVSPVVPPVTIYTNSPLTFCDDTFAILHSSLQDTNFHYQWIVNNSYAIPGATDTVYDGNWQGQVEYNLKVSSSFACYSLSNFIQVNEIQSPGQQYLFLNGDTLSTIWNDSCQWYLDNVPIPGATSYTYIITQPGCYSIEWYYYSSPTCPTMSDTAFCMTVTALQNIANASNSITIYPDPVKNILNIKMNTSTINTTLTILDILGQTVYKTTLNTDFISIPVNTFPAGIYSISLKNDSGCINRKWVKE
jgi:PKD repeat protein